MSDDIRRRLEDAGRRPAPQPEAGFADALETRLLAVARTAPPTPEPPRRPRLWGLRLAVAGTLVATVAVVLALAVGVGRPSPAPELAEPVNVEVALVDGTVLENPDGIRLPDGAVVRVGVGGSARVGDTVLVAGDVATLEGGRVRVEHDQPLGIASDGTPSATRGPAATGAPGSPPRTPSLPAATRTPTTGPTDRPTAAPTHTAAPTPKPSRPPATSDPARSASPSAPTPTPEIVAPWLRARAIGASGVAVTWTRTRGAGTYVLVATVSRVGRAAAPVYPGSRVLGEFARPPVDPLRFRVPDGILHVRLLVVALGHDGKELARSRVVGVTIGG